MLVEMRDICKDYPQGKDFVHILKNINLEVAEGDYLAIMGPSGSGKTTLMNLIGCLDVPTSGEFLLNGEDLRNASFNHLAEVRNRLLGFVFQSFYLLPKLSAVDNVALPLLYRGVGKNERRELAKDALRRMGLGNRLTFRPNQLSGGQCQRIAIARAIVGEPKLLLADEPTGNLDPKTSDVVFAELLNIVKETGLSALIATHNMELASAMDRKVRLEDGRLVNTGISGLISGENFY